MLAQTYTTTLLSTLTHHRRPPTKQSPTKHATIPVPKPPTSPTTKFTTLAAILFITLLALVAAPSFAYADTVTAGNLIISADDGTELTSNDYTYENSTLTILTETPITISMAPGALGNATQRIVLKPNQGETAHITLNGVKLNTSRSNNLLGSAISISEGTNATITLAAGSGNSITSAARYSGIEVLEGSTLTINGEGSLSATCKASGSNAAWGSGIGAAAYQHAGSIIIESGTVNGTCDAADGDSLGAGIGGVGATVTVTGGNATGTSTSSEGSSLGAGIGGATMAEETADRYTLASAAVSAEYPATVTQENGDMNGTSSSESMTPEANPTASGAGIGSAYNGSAVVTLKGGTARGICEAILSAKATGAGIGSGENGSAQVTLSGCDAQGLSTSESEGTYGAGIGAGMVSAEIANDVSIEITGGYARGSAISTGTVEAAGIGGGSAQNGATLEVTCNISGGAVLAEGSKALGSGSEGVTTKFTITGGVFAGGTLASDATDAIGTAYEETPTKSYRVVSNTTEATATDYPYLVESIPASEPDKKKEEGEPDNEPETPVITPDNEDQSKDPNNNISSKGLKHKATPKTLDTTNTLSILVTGILAVTALTTACRRL